jgi:PAS domain S-box-containing protein
MALYHFVLTISKINRTYILYFAFLTLTICFRYFIVSTKLMCDVFPGMNLMAYDRLQRLGIYPIAGFFISYLYHMFPHIGHKTPVRITQVLTILFTILSFLVPPKAVSGVLFTAFYPVFLFVIIYGLYIIVRAIIKKENDALPMAAGVIILVLTAVFDMLIDRDVFPAYNTYQMNKGMIIFIFIQAFIISKRLNRAYTNEKRFREALQGVQSRLELTIEGAKLGLVEWDILHNTWYLNDNFSHMIGFKKDHLIFSRRHWLELIHPEDLKEIDSLLKGAITGKIGNFRCEYRLRMSGGSYRWCLLLGKVLQQNRLGGAEWFVGLHIDISDRKD